MVYKLSIDLNKKLNYINPYLYGSFAEHLGKCVYGGIWVGEKSTIKNESGFRVDVLEALKQLELPVLRWPGGCFADSYHWKDGIGPRNKRPRRYNIWWKQPENNSFGTDEFLKLCAFLKCEPYIAINVGTGNIQEALDWIEYCNSSKNTEFARLRLEYGSIKPYNVRFWGVGNENWGCGGSMTPEYYADLYKQFATYIKALGDNNLLLVACGSNPDFEYWDERLLKNLKSRYFNLVDFLSLHIYTGWGIEQNTITEKDYYKIIADINITKRKIEKAIQLCKLYSKGDSKIKVILDEWGLWYKEAVVENGIRQDGILIDAIFAGLCFHLFHTYSDDLYMTNLAQTTNVLQSFILTKGKDIVLTPTYYLYIMYKPHKDKYLLSYTSESPVINLPNNITRNTLSFSCSISKDNNEIYVTAINIDIKNDYSFTFDDNLKNHYTLKESYIITSNSFKDRNSFNSKNNIELKKQENININKILLKKHSINSFLLIRK